MSGQNITRDDICLVPLAESVAPAPGAFRPWPMRRAVVAMLGLALVWGGSIPVTKLGLEAFSPLGLVSLRYVVCIPFFLWLVRRRPLPAARDLAAMVGFGLVGIGLGQTLQAFGVEHASSSVATVVGALLPVFIVIFVNLQRRAGMRWRHVAGLAAAFLGIVVVAFAGNGLPGAASFGAGQLLGSGLMVLSALAIAAYFGLTAPLVERYSSLTVTAWTSLGGAFALLPVSIGELWLHPPVWSFDGVFAVGYLSLLVTVLGVWVWMVALQSVAAELAGALSYLQPIVGVCLSALLFHDHLGVGFLAGTACVLAGIALSADRSSRPAPVRNSPGG